VCKKIGPYHREACLELVKALLVQLAAEFVLESVSQYERIPFQALRTERSHGREGIYSYRTVFFFKKIHSSA
jgi:hypothetical protein